MLRNLLVIICMMLVFAKANAAPLSFDKSGGFPQLYTNMLGITELLIKDLKSRPEVLKDIRADAEDDYLKHVANFEILYASYIVAQKYDVKACASDKPCMAKMKIEFLTQLNRADNIIVKRGKEFWKSLEGNAPEGFTKDDVRLFWSYQTVELHFWNAYKFGSEDKLENARYIGYLAARLFSDKTIMEIARMGDCAGNSAESCKSYAKSNVDYLKSSELQYIEAFKPFPLSQIAKAGN